LKANPAVQKNFCTTQLVDSHIDQIRANYGFGQIQCKIKVETTQRMKSFYQLFRHGGISIRWEKTFRIFF